MKTKRLDLPNSAQGTKGTFEHPRYSGTMGQPLQFRMKGSPRKKGMGSRWRRVGDPRRLNIARPRQRPVQGAPEPMIQEMDADLMEGILIGYVGKQIDKDKKAVLRQRRRHPNGESARQQRKLRKQVGRAMRNGQVGRA